MLPSSRALCAAARSPSTQSASSVSSACCPAPTPPKVSAWLPSRAMFSEKQWSNGRQLSPPQRSRNQDRLVTSSLQSLGWVEGRCFSLFGRWSHCGRGSWSVVAEGSSRAVAHVAEIILGDPRGAVVWGEHQVGVEHDHAKGPAGREIKDVAEASETFVRLLGMGNEADRLHNP
jgi:hypothetical protein